MRVSFFLFFIYCFCLNLNAQDEILRRLKTDRKFRAYYTTDIVQQYRVTPLEGTAGKEENHTNVHLETTQDILEKKKNYFQADYNVRKFYRIDSTFTGNNEADTASNRGYCPLIKLILQYSGKGAYAGPVHEIGATEYKQRDFRYFYNSLKDMVYTISDSANSQAPWHRKQYDTILYTGFELNFNYITEWKFVRRVDSMGMHCVLLQYNASPQEYTGSNEMMKALGINMVHKGTATIWGTLLLEEKTARVVAFEKNGKFTGTLNIKSPKEEISTPSEFTQRRVTVLTRLEKLPRKKFLGIF